MGEEGFEERLVMDEDDSGDQTRQGDCKESKDENNGAIKSKRKEHGLGEQCARACEEDERKSAGESFVWEDAPHPDLEEVGHPKASTDERGEESDLDQSIGSGARTTE